MRRICLLVLLLVSGCAAEGEKGIFDDALRDLNGDNQRMRSGNMGAGELPVPTMSSSHK